MNTLRTPSDFDRPVQPVDIEGYYLSCCPSSEAATDFFAQNSLAYLKSIATYYLHQASVNADSPRCTLANVLATAKHCDVVLVLHQLKKDEASAALVEPLLGALAGNALGQLAAVMATLRRPLQQLHIPIEARQRVQRFLPAGLPTR